MDAEILRVVYNLQPVAFPEGQIGRRPRLVVVQRHKRSHTSCRKRTFGGEKNSLKEKFCINICLKKTLTLLQFQSLMIPTF